MRDDKYKIIAHLLKEGELNVQQVLSLTKKNITAKGIEIDKKVIPLTEDAVKLLGSYVAKNHIKLSERLFPGKDIKQQSEANFKLGFKAWLKRNNLNPADFGLISQRRKKKVELKTLDEIVNFLK